jgi:histidine triad (HIT) family protein
VTDCLFCRIAGGELPADIVYQDEDVVAFRDINPGAPVHILIIPRRHLSGINDASEGDVSLLGTIWLAAARVAAQEGIGETGFRTVVNQGPDANQTVQHLHMHVMGGRRMSWPPG